MEIKCMIFFLLIVERVRGHVHCDNPVVNLRITSTHQTESDHVRSKRAAENIRITRYYDDSYNSMPNKDAFTSLILDPAVQYWQNSLVIKNPQTSPLLFDRECTGSFTYKTIGSNRLKICSNSCASSKLCYKTSVPNQFIQQCYTSTSNGGYTASGTAGAGAANTDLLLIVTQKTDSCTDSILAYALACELEYVLDRPVIGLINICPGKVNIGVGLQMGIATIKHEIGHVLGFSSNLYAFYRNQSGSPLTPRDSNGLPNLGFLSIGTSQVYQFSDMTVKVYTKTFNYPTGSISKKVSYLVTPTIQNEVRAYFNCPSLEGMMLEDYGSSTSALSHFEKLYLQNELMTPSISIIDQTSRLTLALLQDTGWYTANFNNADNFTFAKGLGCNFIKKSCYDYMNIMQASSQPLSPYCSQTVASAGLSCSSDMKTQIYCNLVVNSALAATIPNQFKYFTSKTLVSSDPFSDYCPMIMVYAIYRSSNLIYTGQCADPQNSVIQGTSNDYFNQGFGINSICIGFFQSWYYESCNAQFSSTIQGAGCYQYQCSPTYGLVIVVNNFQYQCQNKGQIIDVSSRNAFLIPRGKLICPDCSSLCGTTICGKALSTLAVQCNNVDRLCLGVKGYTIPCSSTFLTLDLFQQMILLSFSFLLKL